MLQKYSNIKQKHTHTYKEMGRAYGMYGRQERHVQGSGGETLGNGPIWKN
jgi:hypothetical protein